MTPTLANFFYSLIAGLIVVVIPASVFLFWISQQDKIERRS